MAPRSPDHPEDVVHIAPIPARARWRFRHVGLVLGFIAICLVPLALIGVYLSERAVDQYASQVGFTVQQEGGAALSGLVAQVAGTSAQSETDVLHQFIQSPAIVERVDARLDLRLHYAARYEKDPVFSLAPMASREALAAYWARIVRVTYDQSTRLIQIEARAFDPNFAHQLATAVVAESQILINELNSAARRDAIRFAETDLDEARDRLRDSREALVVYRSRTQIVDPVSDLEARLGVVNTLQQQLAEALVAFDLLLEGDPRIAQAEREIRVIRNRIAEERQTVSQGGLDGETDYPSLLAEYEGLLADRDFAEQGYHAALDALDVARANAARGSRYIATFIAPTLPETAIYPRRMETLLLAGFFLFLTWTILSLVFYALRDSR